MRSEGGSVHQLLFALGLCAKAGKLIYGVPMICESLKKGKAPVLVLSASDNAPNSAKRLRDRCSFYGVHLCMAQISGEELAHAVGKSGRISAVAVTDFHLGQLVLSKLGEKEQNENSGA